MSWVQTFFSMEHIANAQPFDSARLQSRASIHSLFPELGTPVMIVSSPGTTCQTLIANIFQICGAFATKMLHALACCPTEVLAFVEEKSTCDSPWLSNSLEQPWHTQTF